MKKFIAITFLAGALGGGSLLAQGSSTAPLAHRRTYAPAVPNAQTEGSLQAAARVGNPLQALNPFAPAEYGSGAPYVEQREGHDQSLRPRDRSRNQPSDLRLFSFSF